MTLSTTGSGIGITKPGSTKSIWPMICTPPLPMAGPLPGTSPTLNAGLTHLGFGARRF